MPARRLDGTAVAAAIRDRTAARRVAAFTSAAGRPPALSIVLVGDDPASQVYVRERRRPARESGLAVTVHRLPATSSLDDVLALVDAPERATPRCDGILVQSPLPAAMGQAREPSASSTPSTRRRTSTGFIPRNVGRLVQGRAALAPCTPSGVIELLRREGVAIAGRHAVVIGRSEIVGKPMALLLLQRDATVTVCHSRTPDLPAVARQGDIARVGHRPARASSRADMVKPGAAVVDVGTTPRRPIATRSCALFGDGQSAARGVRQARDRPSWATCIPAVADVAGALSPVPGGVGPLTIAMLLKNTLRRRARPARRPA